MLFSSLSFLTVFLPVTIILYYAVKQRFIRNVILLIASMLFYAWGEPVYVFLMFIVVGFDFVMVKVIHRLKLNQHTSLSRILFIGTLLINFASLGFFKYINFIIENLNLFGLNLSFVEVTMPIGISFYTFQIVSYVIDAYYDRVKVQNKLYLLLTYTCLFPQLIAGPIVRYATIEHELEFRQENLDDFNQGIQRFVLGLAKKVIIANNVALMANHVFNEIVPSDLTFTFAWLGIIAYTLQIYFDFSAYSDMAIGLGKIFGFHFLENFNYPYVATSITDFWRRWHISLSTWFRDYVYIPLGGNRTSKLRLLLNIMIVWMLTGLWHGASWNFVVWGLYFSVFLIIEKLFLEKAIKRLFIIRNIYVLIVVMISWVIFNTRDLSHARLFVNALVNYKQGFNFTSLAYSKYLFTWPYYAIGLLGVTPLFRNIGLTLKKHLFGEIFIEVFIAICLFFTIMFLVNDSYNPFIYFRF